MPRPFFALLVLALAACGPVHTGPFDAGAGGSGGGGGGAGGGGSDAGSEYPAAHPPLPQLINRNQGPVLTTPRVYFVFYPGYPFETQLDDFAQKLPQSAYWATVTAEYGVGALAYEGALHLVGQTPPAMISSTDLHQWVTSELQTGALGPPDTQGIYTFVFPAGTVITQPNPVNPLFGTVQSCVAFGGYHDNAALPLTDGGTLDVAYAVIPTCGTSVDSLTDVLSHEWIEASTDPILTSSGAFDLTGGPKAAFFNVDQDHVVWGVLGGGEAADLCEFNGPLIEYTPPDLGYVVQRSWSNLLAAQSHDPCAPDVAGAFFDSAPVLPETVTFNSALTGTVVTQGVTIPVHQSKTIEVRLFSDGPTAGEWNVTADDLMYKFYGQYGLARSLDFAWDKTSGKNGDVLHLTVTVTGQSPIGGGHGVLITSTLGQRVALWPFLVVE